MMQSMKSYLLLKAALVAVCLPSLPLHGADPTPLARLLDEAWEYDLNEGPLWATEVGEHRANDQLPRERPEDAGRRIEKKREFLARLAKIDRSKLPRLEQINYDIFRRQ